DLRCKSDCPDAVCRHSLFGKDFAYWRALTKAIETAATPAKQAWFEDVLQDETSWKRPPAVQQQSVRRRGHRACRRIARNAPALPATIRTLCRSVGHALRPIATDQTHSSASDCRDQASGSLIGLSLLTRGRVSCFGLSHLGQHRHPIVRL